MGKSKILRLSSLANKDVFLILTKSSVAILDWAILNGLLLSSDSPI